MDKPKGGLNARVAHIVSTVLGDMTLEQAAIRLDYKLSKEAIRALKSGKVGREVTVRTFAEGFWEEICAHFQAEEEVVPAGEECGPGPVSDWFARVAGFGRSEEVASPGSDGGVVALSDASIARLLELLDERLLKRQDRAEDAERFADVFSDVTKACKPEDLEAILEITPRELASLQSGKIPSAGTLVRWAGLLELDVTQADRLLIAAGYRGWEPERAITHLLLQLNHRYSPASILSAIRPKDMEDAGDKTPIQVLDTIQGLERRVGFTDENEAWARDWLSPANEFYAQLWDLIFSKVLELDVSFPSIWLSMPVPPKSRVLKDTREQLQDYLKSADLITGEGYLFLAGDIEARPSSRRFARLMRYAADGRPANSIARSVILPVNVVTKVFEGYIPPPSQLKRILAVLQKPVEQHRLPGISLLNEILFEAGYLAWDPRYALDVGLQALADKWGFRAVPDMMDLMRDTLTWSEVYNFTPRQVESVLAKWDEILADYQPIINRAGETQREYDRASPYSRARYSENAELDLYEIDRTLERARSVRASSRKLLQNQPSD